MNRVEIELARSIEPKNATTRALEVRSEWMIEQINELGTQQERMADRLNTRSDDAGSGVRRPNIKYVLPEYKGDTSPIRYINAMRQYWRAVKPAESDTHYLIERSLTGSSGNWWQIIKEDVNDLVSFIENFSKRYWNEPMQLEIRRRLKFGCHQLGKGVSRVDYAISMYTEARELSPQPSVKEIIYKLARHFSEEIKYAIIGRGIAEMDQLIELLESFDNVGAINATRNEGKEWKPRRTEEMQQNGSTQPSSTWRTNLNGNN